MEQDTPENHHSSDAGQALIPPTHEECIRLAEAILFASAAPVTEEELLGRLPEGSDVARILNDLEQFYALRGVNLVRVAGGWAFRTATDLGFMLARNIVENRKLSRAAIETLAIIAYHQPVTRAEIEEIRGVTTSKGTIDTLLETSWIRLRGRRRSPGRPVTYGTTRVFLDHFGLDAITDLPGLEELKGAGLLEGRLPAGLDLPLPNDTDTLLPDEDPLDEGDLFYGMDTENQDEDETEPDGEI
ncbi:SMC-Scp complex subunit ScpB [Microvirga sp. W0021]|uniref:SMC-Scp complex subunit ScpB n=1 Tax=Hohaiivirga grylli TaxID=3133970 RepID=A0ABV0BIY8_9HYPH